MYPGAGIMPGQGTQLMPTPGASQYPPSFNYGVAPGSYSMTGAGSVGSLAVGAAGAAPGALMGLGGLASLGSMFMPNSAVLGGLSLLDPTEIGFNIAGRAFSGAGGFARMGPALGAGAMAGALPIAAGLAGAAAISYAGDHFVQGASSLNETSARLSGLSFGNTSAADGRGFSHQQMSMINRAMRQFQVNDPFVEMRDMNSMLDQFTGFGMEQGVRDAREFSEKFTKFVGAVREVAEQLGTTMQEASAFFGQSRSAGFYSAADVSGNMRSFQALSGLGMSGESFGGMQASAAGTARGQGLAGRAGAASSARFAQSFMIGATGTASGGAGILSSSDLMDLTGTTNLGDASSQMGARAAGTVGSFLRNTSTGRAMMAALGEQRDGRFTGGLDSDAVSDFLGGNVGLADLSSRAGSRMTTSNQRLSFTANQGALASSLLESPDGADAVFRAITEEAKNWAQRSGVEDQDAIRHFLQTQLGQSEKEARVFQDMIANRNRIRSATRANMLSEIRAAEMRLEISRNRTVAGLSQRISGNISDFMSPVAQMGADVATLAENRAQDVMDATFGISRGDVSSLSAQNFTDSVAMGQTALGDVAGAGGGFAIDATRGSAFRGMVLDMGSANALDAQATAAAGGTVDAGLSREAKSLVSRNIQQSGDRLRAIGLRYQMAKRGGADPSQLKAIMDEFESASRGSGGSLYTSHRSKQMAATTAAELGIRDLAQAYVEDGEMASKSYKTLSERRSNTYDIALASGLSESQARELSEGRGGASVIAAIGRKGDAALFDRLAKQGGGADAFMAAVRSELGADFSDEDIQAAFEVHNASGGIGKERATVTLADRKRAVERLGMRLASPLVGTLGAGLGADLTSFMSGRTVYDDVGTIFGARAEHAGGSLMSNIAGQENDAASETSMATIRANLASLPTSVRERIPEDLMNRLVTGDSDAFSELAQLVASGNMDGVIGGQTLSSIGQRMRVGGTSLQDLRSQFGEKNVEKFMKGMGIEGSVGPEQLAELTQALGKAAVLGELSSGAGGGLALRGASVQDQTLIHLMAVGESLGKVTAVVDALYKDAGEPPLNPVSATSG